jgi:hypothetical protein
MTKRRNSRRPDALKGAGTAFVLPAVASSVAMAAVAAVCASANISTATTASVEVAAQPVTLVAAHAPRRTVSRSGDRAAMTIPQPAGLSMAPCPSDGVEVGLQPAAIRVHRAVCNAFPQIARYGGLGAGEHATGKAIDIMTTDVALGYEIAAFLQAHAAELDLYDVIYRQHIWTPVRAAEGWRLMPDRGSLTANHFDHVHVSVN